MTANSIAALSLIRRSLGGQATTHTSSTSTSVPTASSVPASRIVSGPVAVNVSMSILPPIHVC